MQVQKALFATMHVDWRVLQCDGAAELYLTIRPEPGAEIGVQARHAFAAARDFLQQAHARIFCERIFATANSIGAIETIRHAIYGEIDDGVKPTLIAVLPGSYGQFAGVQIHAFRGEHPPTPLSCPGNNNGALGRRIQIDDSAWLYINGLNAASEVGEAEQARQMFYCTGRVLRRSGATMKSVARTWFWLRNICGWYDEFNKVRNVFYEQEGLINGTECSTRLPASTGVGLCGAGRVACTLDLIALPGAEDKIQLMASGGDQDSAFKYGSAFSRAALAPMPAGPTLFISGTAAIDRNGATEHVGEIESQIKDTIAHVRALLTQANCTDDHVLTSLAFCKSPKVEQVFREGWSDLSWPRLTLVGDLCRPELLFEVEVTASPVCFNQGIQPSCQP